MNRLFTVIKILPPAVLASICFVVDWSGARESDTEFLIFSLWTAWVFLWDKVEFNSRAIKGAIQYDFEHYEVPAIQILFDGDPVDCAGYDEVVFKIEKKADLSGIDVDDY